MGYKPRKGSAVLAVAEKAIAKKQEGFDIVEVARRCGISVLKQLPDGQWLARCPFCGDSQKSQQHGHLYLKQATGEYKCQRCGEGGYAIGLYARLRGIDTKTAYKELSYYTVSGYTPEIRYDPCKRVVIAPEEPIAPIEHRHEVYTSLIKVLPLLSAHRADLLRRGLSEAVIERNGYRSLPVVPKNRLIVCKKLLQKHDLTGIPGFYINKEGEWDMASVSGYLIPVRDPKGMIQGMQIRLENSKDGKKYIWFSSRGRQNGCGARAWVHVAQPLGNPPEKRIWITEGPLKSDVSAHYLGTRFLGVPGASAWSNVVETARALGVKEIILAYDADQRDNPAIKKNARELAEELKSNRIKVLPAVWPLKIGKGIDDACVTLTKERKVVTEAYFLVSVKVTRTRTVTETVKIEGHSSSLLEKASGWLKKILK
jgi:hypothetical protein